MSTLSHSSLVNELKYHVCLGFLYINQKYLIKYIQIFFSLIPGPRRCTITSVSSPW